MEAIAPGTFVKVVRDTRTGRAVWFGTVIHHEVNAGRDNYVHIHERDRGRMWLSTTDESMPTHVIVVND